MTAEEAIQFAEYAQIMERRPDVREFYKLAEIALRAQQKLESSLKALESNEPLTLDAVEVVRCKYCIRRYDTDECPMCYLSGGQYVEDTSDDSYCSRGAKMDGGENGE